jgi:uncharacterized paraquat-inducible protein A
VIRCVCPNGHVIKVKDSMAGKAGLCPTCKARVKVPELRQEPVSEDAILEILGPTTASPQSDTVINFELGDTATIHSHHERGTPKKSCHKCNQEIPSGNHICPHCHTYIANLNDF